MAAHPQAARRRRTIRRLAVCVSRHRPGGAQPGAPRRWRLRRRAARLAEPLMARVLDFTSDVGAYGTRLLAELGHDVVRIEPPGGDALRREANGMFHAF